MSEIIVLMGAPGAGKGTQARYIQDRRSIPQISTGDIFRAMKDAQTPLAEEVRGIMNAGILVPDEVTIRVVRDRTSSQDCSNGYILDGFPRTTVQAEMLEKLATEQGNSILAISVEVPFDILEQRVTGRRNCPECGEIYNVNFKPPKVDNVCDLHPDVELVQRSDDTSEKIKVRLATYEQQTQPLLDYYDSTGRLRRIDGTRSPETIYADIEKILASRN